MSLNAFAKQRHLGVYATFMCMNKLLCICLCVCVCGCTHLTRMQIYMKMKVICLHLQCFYSNVINRRAVWRQIATQAMAMQPKNFALPDLQVYYCLQL